MLISRPKRVITVLGMHRSGTSCLTGSLQASGLELGKFHAGNLHNKKGNRENQDIIDLHESLLKHNKASWDQPALQCSWPRAQVTQAKAILKNYCDLPLWGFKDPRTLSAMGGWLKILPNLERVGIFRHPLLVAQSLVKRNQFSLEQGFSIWLKYNTLLLREFRRESFPILSFDLSEEQFLLQVQRLVDHLKLEHVSEYASFFEEELRTQSVTDSIKLPSKVKELYTQLKLATW